MGTLNLKAKILMMTAGVVMMSAVSMMFFVKTALYQKLFIKLQERGFSIATYIAEYSIAPILTEQFFELEMMARDVKSSEEDIEYICILNNDGEVLAHTFEEGFPVDLKSANIIGAGQTRSVQAVKMGTKDILDIAVPVLKGEVGSIHLGLSRDSIKRDINDIVMLMLWIITAVMSAGVVAAIFLSKTITRPVSELAEAVRIVGCGDLGHIVHVSTHDEIGQLADHFNKMTKDLKKREDELENLIKETKELSLHDPLTGLANRRLMDYVLETEFARARRTEYPFSVIMLDIDYFKNYNDTYGHTVGDKMLVNLAKIISREVRHVDLGVRYGGEEFLIILSETGLSEACEVAERIRREVEEEAGITISLGVSSYNHNMMEKQEIISRADEALLRAKQKGRNRIEVTV